MFFSKTQSFLVLAMCLLTLSAFAKNEIISKKKFIFEHSFKDVWSSAQTVLGTYSLETNDITNGLIKTTELKSGQFWQPPFEDPIEGYFTQTLSFQFYKQNPNRTELQIIKTAKKRLDFLGSQRSIEIGPWEELRLVYKIKREVEVKKILSQIK